MAECIPEKMKWCLTEQIHGVLIVKRFEQSWRLVVAVDENVHFTLFRKSSAAGGGSNYSVWHGH